MKNSKKLLNLAVKKAHKQGFRIKKDERLTPTPYRASHPLVEKMIGVKNKGKVITYDPNCVKTDKRKAMDINHEIIEYNLMKKGKTYKQAHKIANKKQRDFDAT
jgi:hypothetical protein